MTARSFLALALLGALPAAAGEVRVGDGWTAATGAETARLYLQVENAGAEAVAVIGFSTGRGDAVLVAPGFDRTRQVKLLGEYPLEPGAVLDMAPGGPHVALTGLSEPLREGERIALRVLLSGGAAVDASVLVEGPDAEDDDHGGHDR